MFEVFEHTADVGLRIRAADLNTLFAEAGRALFSLIVENLDAVRPATEVTFHLQGQDLEYLLFDWLNELLYCFETQHLVFSQFKVDVTPTGLAAVARGERFDPARHQPDHEVKAITYHGLRVKQEEHGWLAEVIVDI
ncbi:MAG: archease [Gemmatales bacterium]|nr:archease [Gemmatales bacterium]MDW8385400.1 archease [Gemmatales bacterium]